MSASRLVVWTTASIFVLSVALNGLADDKVRKKKGAPGQDGNGAVAGQVAGAGPANAGDGLRRQEGGPIGQRQMPDFDPAAFSAAMIQQFDQSGDGKLNQSELAACLDMLYQQVMQQQQQMKSSGGPGQSVQQMANDSDQNSEMSRAESAAGAAANGGRTRSQFSGRSSGPGANFGGGANARGNRMQRSGNSNAPGGR
jgi:hypothetical protein